MAKINEIELKEIFQNFKNSDNRQIDIFYEKYYDLVYGITFSILKNKENSEDVTQEVFEKIIKLDKDKFPTTGEASWLYTVTKNEVFQFLRKQKKLVDIDELFSLESESNEIDDIVDMTSYYKLIDNLNSIDREIISLRILSDFTFDKIAQILNMPIGTVQWRYYKALHSIKLTISSLAMLLVVYNVWSISHRFSNSIEDSDLSELSKPENISTYDKSESYYNQESITTFSVESSDFSGASENVGRISGAIKNIAIIGICTILLIFTIFFAVKSKVKIKRKRNKKEVNYGDYFK